MEIIWKDIPDFPQYQINNMGQVRSFKNSKEGKLLTLSETSNSDPRLKVKLSKDNKCHSLSVHRLMMKIFCPVENMDALQVNHIDGNPQNNILSNLEWVTSEENHKHYKETLIPQRKEEGTFTVGRKPDILKITFNSGIVHYYAGETEAIAALGISRNTIGRIKAGEKNNKFGISSIEVVCAIPPNYSNQPVALNNPIKQVVIEYWKKPTETYENCRDADRALGISIGTVQRWSTRDWSNINNGRASTLGIKRVYKI